MPVPQIHQIIADYMLRTAKREAPGTSAPVGGTLAT